MANDLNLCQFIGRLGRDPEQSYMPNGNAVCKISIAVGESWKDQSGQKQERTTWVPIVAFGKLAEIMGQYLAKGSRIYISGKFQVRKWQGQDGQDRYTTEIIASNMQMLDARNDDNQGRQQNTRSQSAPPQQQQRGAPPPQQTNDFYEDDIPF